MGYQHGLGVGSFEDKDVVNQAPLTAAPILIGTVSGSNVYALFPQAALTCIDASVMPQIDFIIPQYNWYRGPSYFFARITPGASFTITGNVAVTKSMTARNLYAFVFDPFGTRVNSASAPPYDPNPTLVLAPAFLAGWLRLPTGLWYPA